jgi:hypothetical protein
MGLTDCQSGNSSNIVYDCTSDGHGPYPGMSKAKCTELVNNQAVTNCVLKKNRTVVGDAQNGEEKFAFSCTADQACKTVSCTEWEKR